MIVNGYILLFYFQNDNSQSQRGFLCLITSILFFETVLMRFLKTVPDFTFPILLACIIEVSENGIKLKFIKLVYYSSWADIYISMYIISQKLFYVLPNMQDKTIIILMFFYSFYTVIYQIRIKIYCNTNAKFFLTWYGNIL